MNWTRVAGLGLLAVGCHHDSSRTCPDYDGDGYSCDDCNDDDPNMQAVGFVDDDPSKRGRMIHGVRVLGPAEELKQLVDSQQIDELVISVSKLPEERVSTIAKLCGDAGIKLRTLRIAFE